MIRGVGRRTPRQLLKEALAAKPAAASLTRPTPEDVVGSSSNTTQFDSPLRPVYLELSQSFAPKQDDPTPRETVVALNPTVFGEALRRDILHLCIVQYRDGLRQGSANTKTRGEVAGSGRKIRPQKGSGRARLGDAQSPMLRGGGVAFGPKPRDFSTKLPRKVIDMGMRVALSQKVKESALGVMHHMDWSVPKTKSMVARLEAMQLTNTLFVTGQEEVPAPLSRAMANIAHVDVISVYDLNIHDVLTWERVVLDAKAVEYLEETLARRPAVHSSVAPLPISRNALLLEAAQF
ncbi:ribosomal protein L4 [Cylindrobasidium torrendii FP15055 ss-10]|uniref:Large ribosomal subunit protein uL4m n=1 Tax=Cylindrobasidium torrendii FP15055 ss-10 TaxID=1314674 RepID=A0A0D7BLJ5_9AGAR|nr:ribosomal protein L4 [Cylindrobasidium torrendii FP15055 ss-10]